MNLGTSTRSGHRFSMLKSEQTVINLMRSIGLMKRQAPWRHVLAWSIIIGLSYLTNMAIHWATNDPVNHRHEAMVFLFVVGPYVAFGQLYLYHVMRAEERLTRLASTDSLTGLLNRPAFFDALKEKQIEGAEGWVVLADADNFKALNDTHGHQAGDHALVAIARHFEECAGPHGVVGRLGGEEFALFIPDAQREAASCLCSGVILDTTEGAPWVTLSAGVTKLDHELSVTDTVNVADSALLSAKSNGRAQAQNTDGTVLCVASRSTASNVSALDPRPVVTTNFVDWMMDGIVSGADWVIQNTKASRLLIVFLIVSTLYMVDIAFRANVIGFVEYRLQLIQDMINGTPYVIMIYVTSEKMLIMNRELARLARFDPLTGLLNRRSFFQRMTQHRAPNGVLLIADADHFKSVNDTHGHSIGDESLCALARHLETVCGDDAVIGRLGGEEFGIFLPKRNMEDIENIREKLCAGAKVETATGTVNLTVSVGATTIRTGEKCEPAMVRADEALYRAKARGRRQLCVAA